MKKYIKLKVIQVMMVSINTTNAMVDEESQKNITTNGLEEQKELKNNLMYIVNKSSHSIVLFTKTFLDTTGFTELQQSYVTNLNNKLRILRNIGNRLKALEIIDEKGLFSIKEEVSYQNSQGQTMQTLNYLFPNPKNETISKDYLMNGIFFAIEAWFHGIVNPIKDNLIESKKISIEQWQTLMQIRHTFLTELDDYIIKILELSIIKEKENWKSLKDSLLIMKQTNEWRIKMFKYCYDEEQFNETQKFSPNKSYDAKTLPLLKLS